MMLDTASITLGPGEKLGGRHLDHTERPDYRLTVDQVLENARGASQRAFPALLANHPLHLLA